MIIHKDYPHLLLYDEKEISDRPVAPAGTEMVAKVDFRFCDQKSHEKVIVVKDLIIVAVR